MTRYKFMANILQKSGDRGTHVGWLARLGIDAKISFKRIIIAAALWIVLLIIFMNQITSQASSYVFIPSIIILIASTGLILLYALPSRDGSLLITCLNLVKFWWFEKRRFKSPTDSVVKTIGIKGYYKGILLFDNEESEYGVLYSINGHLSSSTLPAIAELVADSRLKYLIARSESSQDKLITSIKKADLSTQMDALKYIYEQSNTNTKIDNWRRRMAAINYEYIDTYMRDKEYVVEQILLIRDRDFKSLKKTINTFETAVHSGLYASAEMITDINEIVEKLGTLTMLSKKGIAQNVKKNC